MYFHSCIFTPYDTLKCVIDAWEKKCSSLVVVEHPPDGKTKRVHCHFLIETESGENWFRDEAKKVMGEFVKRGNYWIATRVQKGDHAGKPIDRASTLVYMLKGKYSPKFVKNFSNQEVEESRLAWVDSVKNEHTGDHSEKVIKEVMERFVIDKKLHGRYKKDDDYEYDGIEYKLDLLFDDVRNVAWKKLWGEHRKAPQPWVYKMIATTAFVRLCEDNGMLNAAVGIVQEKWY